MKEEVATKTVSSTETIINQISQPVQSGNFGEFMKQLWSTHGDSIIHFGKIMLLVLLTVLLAWIFTRITKRIITNTSKKIQTVDDSVGHVVFVFIRSVIWLLALLVVLDLFGVNTASILTVLGTVGLAIALAMKDSMSNIAAGLMLMILRPYKTGDFVQCGAITGTIKVIGVFCTEVMTFEGVYVSVPNSVIFGTPVTNYSRNETRRAVLSVGVSYSDDIEKGVEVIKQMLQEQELVLKDPAYEVHVDTLADSSVNLTIRFWAKTETYWDAYWQVKAAVKPTLEKAGLNIPFPQRVVTIVNKAE
ncbi:MAG: mechanosensitive ion channel family protein [Lentisphaerae bacterium]|nr:mechanosensitive ion channel family protein [Lentisphaerota bacterium]